MKFLTPLLAFLLETRHQMTSLLEEILLQDMQSRVIQAGLALSNGHTPCSFNSHIMGNKPTCVPKQSPWICT